MRCPQLRLASRAGYCTGYPTCHQRNRIPPPPSCEPREAAAEPGDRAVVWVLASGGPETAPPGAIIAGTRRRFPRDPEDAMRRMPRLGQAVLLAACAVTALVLPATAQAQGTLTLYCSPQIEWCQLVIAEFTKATGIKVAMTRKSSGETFAQIKAEASNPKGDVWWGGTGDPHLQAAEEGLTQEYRSPRLGELQEWATAQAKAAQVPHRRHLRRRPRVRLQHRAAREEEAAGAEVLEGPGPARVQGRGPGRRSQLVGHLVHDAGHDGPALRRGRGLRLLEEAPPQRQPVHQVGLGADQGRRPGRDHHRHRLHARCGDDGRAGFAHQGRRARARAPATRSAR